MRSKLSKKAKIIIASIIVVVLFLGGVATWAANRYLIEHVEIDLSEEVPVDNQVVANTETENNTDSTKNRDLKVLEETPEGATASPKENPAKTPEGATASPKENSVKTPDGVTASPKGEPAKTPDANSSPKGNPTKASGKVTQTTQKVSPSPVKKQDPPKNNGPEKFTATDMSYKSDSKTINIQKVVMGEGKDTVTYFVADIKLTDGTQMKSAFAKNKFGRNIIEGTSEIAENNGAILAINGDYYGFRDDGIEIRNGRLFRDKPARTGLATYKDGSMKIYDEKQTSGESLVNSGVWNTVSFGPALVVDGKISSDIENYEVDTNFGNHSMQGLHPRTGIGMIEKNHFVFIVVDGRNEGYSKGMELQEFAKVFQNLGCKIAYNIDGGGSATMCFMGKRLNNPCGKDKERGTSDIFYIK